MLLMILLGDFLDQCFSTGVFLPFGGYVGTSEEIFVFITGVMVLLASSG